ncbi:hypothetical protein DFH09DRAFT_1083340 [Mycena vulgaris]|nr:hypothetical protein DFH09DRAFT_1083340 [Mycena vulgaris]
MARFLPWLQRVAPGQRNSRTVRLCLQLDHCFSLNILIIERQSGLGFEFVAWGLSLHSSDPVTREASARSLSLPSSARIDTIFTVGTNNSRLDSTLDRQVPCESRTLREVSPGFDAGALALRRAPSSQRSIRMYAACCPSGVDGASWKERRSFSKRAVRMKEGRILSVVRAAGEVELREALQPALGERACIVRDAFRAPRSGQRAEVGVIHALRVALELHTLRAGSATHRYGSSHDYYDLTPRATRCPQARPPCAQRPPDRVHDLPGDMPLLRHATHLLEAEPVRLRLQARGQVVQGDDGFGERAVRALGEERRARAEGDAGLAASGLGALASESILRLNGGGLATNGANRGRGCHRRFSKSEVSVEPSFRDIAASWRCAGPACFPRSTLQAAPNGNEKEVRVIVLGNPLCRAIEPSRALIEVHSLCGSPSRAPQRDSGRSYVGSAGARTLSESSDAPSARGVITPDARTARSPQLPYPRTMHARSETETYGSPAREYHMPGSWWAWTTGNRDWSRIASSRRSAAHETPPRFRALLADPGAECLTYGARTRAEGGLQGLPQLHFPDGALIGRPAGVVNTAEIKGTSNAMRSSCPRSDPRHRPAYWSSKPRSTLTPRSSPPRNLRCSSPAPLPPPPTNPPLNPPPPSSTLSNPLRNPPPPTPAHRHAYSAGARGPLGRAQRAPRLRHAHRARGRRALCRGGHRDVEGTGATNSKTWPDALATRPAAACAPIACPAFEPPRSTDLMSSVALTGTNPAAGEAVHLRVMRGVDGPALSGEGECQVGEGMRGRAGDGGAHVTRACPAGMYEYMADDGGRVVLGNAGYVSYDKLQADGEAERWEGTKLGINSQDITWTVPGGGSPSTGLNVDNHAEEQEHMGGRGAGNHIIAHSPS